MKGRPRILAVDDEPAILSLLRRILEPEGYEVVTAANGEQALALLEEAKLDLVLLDIMMPGLDGFQLLDRIRQRCDVPVIVLTARHEATTEHEALRLGADDYMRKPFSSRELLARIRAKLEHGMTAP